MANPTSAGAPGVTHEEIMLQLRATDKRLVDGDHRFLSMENTLKAIGSALNDLHEGQTAIRDEFSPVLNGMTEIKSMIEGAQFIKTGTRYAKWIGFIAGIITAVVLAVKVSVAAIARALP